MPLGHRQGIGKPGAVAGRLVMCGLGMTAPSRRSVKGRLISGFIARGSSAAAGIALLAAGGALPAAAQSAGSHGASAARTWLTAVAASSARAAFAVGYGGNGTLSVRWNGRTWRRTRVPGVPGGGGLFGVTSTSARDAWAVGEAGDPDNGYTKTL